MSARTVRDLVWQNLRSELHFLKNCQVQYFILSVTATGAVAGFGDEITNLKDAPSVYLAPLLVILPCWWIFFDKATTISRIVAYLRHLERALRTKELGRNQKAHHGWETALGEYRRIEAKQERPAKIVAYAWGLWYGLSRTLVFRTTHKYWSINWLTFAGLSATCLVLAQLDTAHWNSSALRISSWLVGISGFHNLSVVGRLTRGSASYEAAYVRWSQVFAELDDAREEPC
jgi:hypothetical protein